jgi:hypothetical protein
MCGAQFYERVRRRHATKDDDYGYFQLPRQLDGIARARVRFALITGTKDFRHGNILDLFHDGFEKHGLTTQLIDVPGMRHRMCSQEALLMALDFVDR